MNKIYNLADEIAKENTDVFFMLVRDVAKIALDTNSLSFYDEADVMKFYHALAYAYAIGVKTGDIEQFIKNITTVTLKEGGVETTSILYLKGSDKQVNDTIAQLRTHFESEAQQNCGLFGAIEDACPGQYVAHRGSFYNALVFICEV